MAKDLNKSIDVGTDKDSDFMPWKDLHPRDNSGGIDFTPYSAKWGDGGKITKDPGKR
jgi:hypothetical protein